MLESLLDIRWLGESERLLLESFHMCNCMCRSVAEIWCTTERVSFCKYILFAVLREHGSAFVRAYMSRGLILLSEKIFLWCLCLVLIQGSRKEMFSVWWLSYPEQLCGSFHLSSLLSWKPLGNNRSPKQHCPQMGTSCSLWSSLPHLAGESGGWKSSRKLDSPQPFW